MPRGYSTAADALRTTVDGADLNEVWNEHQATLDLINSSQDSLRAMLSFSTTAAGADVPQSPDIDGFEDESEFGVPVGLRGPGAFLRMGFNLRFRDRATRFTHAFLRDADRADVAAVHNAVLAADNKQIFQAVLGSLFNPTNRVNPEGLTIYGLYNADGVTPPPWNGQSFDGTHDHYLVSGAVALDGGDLIDAYRHVAHHGHGDPAAGGRVVIFVNPVQGEAVRGFRKGADSTAPHDFVNAAGSDVYLTDKQIVGQPVPNRLGSVPIIGSYGPALISETHLVPVGYVAAVATYGPNDQRNPIAFREHVRSELRGLRQIPGGNGSYPLQDSYYSRGFGTGVRVRGGAVVMQVKATGVYETPSDYLTVVA